MKKIILTLFTLLFIVVLVINIEFIGKQYNIQQQLETSVLETTAIESAETPYMKEIQTESDTETKETTALDSPLYYIENFTSKYQGELCEVNVDAEVYLPKCPLTKYVVGDSKFSNDTEGLLRFFFQEGNYYKSDNKIYDIYEYENDTEKKSFNCYALGFVFSVRYKSKPAGSDSFYDRISEEDAAKACRDTLVQLGIHTWDEYKCSRTSLEDSSTPVYSFRFWGRCGGIRISNNSYRTGDPVEDLIDGENIEVDYGPEGICYISIIQHREPIITEDEYQWEELLTPDEACQALTDEIDLYNGMIKTRNYSKISLVYLPGTEPGDKKIGGRFVPFWEFVSDGKYLDLVNAVTGEAFVK